MTRLPQIGAHAPAESAHMRDTGLSMTDNKKNNPRAAPGPRQVGGIPIPKSQNRIPVRQEAAKPKIIIRPELSEIISEAERALASRADCPVFTRGDSLVHITKDDASDKLLGITRPRGAPTIRRVREPWLREQIDLAAEFGTWKERKKDAGDKEFTFDKAMPPLFVAKTLAARDGWPLLRPLEGVIENPVFRPEGSILCKPGYDPSTGLVYLPSSAKFPPIPDNPSADQVQRAVYDLLTPIADFPFAADCGKSAVICAILSILARPAIGGPCPMFFFRGNCPGTGKGLCAELVSLIGTGRPPALMTVPRADDETRKRLLAIGLEGLPVALLDNVVGCLRSKSMAAALTATSFTDRYLGESRSITVPMLSLWLGTGNNVTFGTDLGRRVVPIDLETDEDHPEDRTDFKIPNLRAYVKGIRPQLVAGALTILRGFHVAGRRKHGEPRKGSFEDFDDLARSAVIWAGLPDPLAGCKSIREDSDADLEVLRAGLDAWATEFGESPVTTGEVIERCRERGSLFEALTIMVGCRPDQLTSVNLGTYLRDNCRRPLDGRRFNKAEKGARGGVAKWIVQRLGGLR